MIRDLLNRTGRDDPAANKKISHAQKVADAQKLASCPALQAVAGGVFDGRAGGLRDTVVASLLAVARMTTEPFAVVMAQKVAADEMNNFANAIRKELGKTQYTPPMQ